MENTTSLPPSLIIFVFFSLIVSIWAIVDIFRSAFTKFYKFIWLFVVLFAPFGCFIYLFIGRRLKPFPQGASPKDGSEGAPPPGEKGAASQAARPAMWPAPLVLLAVGIFCVLLYLRLLPLLGQETMAFILLGAMIVVGAVLVFYRLGRATKH
jgi:hypothetical protein